MDRSSGVPVRGDLAGVQVVLLRSADRSGDMLAELRRRGAEPSLLPLIDFEKPADDAGLAAALHRLREGGFAWLAVTSATAVRALKQHAPDLRDLVPVSTRVAVVGSATRRAVEAEGLPVDLAPVRDQSAGGLLEIMPAGSGRVLLPQADIAADTLIAGMAALGWDVEAVVAYRTVDYPAAPERRLTAGLVDAPDATVSARLLGPAEFSDSLAMGQVQAVVLASPSAARRLRVLTGGLPDNVVVLALGRSTAAVAASLGFSVAGVAAAPTPAGIADALAAVVGTEEKGDDKT